MCIKNLETFEPHRGLIGHSDGGLIKEVKCSFGFGGNLTTCEKYTAALSMKQSRADILHGRKCSYCVFSPQAAADDLK